jgi:hypothetical protein
MADSDGDVGVLSDLWWFIGIMVVLGVLWIAGGGAARYGKNVPSPIVVSPLVTQPRTVSNPTYPSNGLVYVGNRNFSNSNSVSSVLDYRRVQISRGNASSEYQPSQEYIVLKADYSNQAPVSITGWTLTNGRGQKLAIESKRFVEQPSTRVTIPTGTLLFDPSRNQVEGPIILNPGDRAYVITGSGQSYGKYPIKTSFKTNKCSGYIEEQNGRELEPPLSGNQCPDLEEEVALDSLPDQCYDFVRDLSRCHIPKTGENYEGERTVDGRTGIPKICVDFIKPYLNYGSCLKRHIGDPDFFGNEWRIYLNQRWEMWAERRETITLSDASGNIIDQITY